MAARAIQTFDEMRAPVLEAWLLASRNAVFLDAEPLPAAIPPGCHCGFMN